MKAVPPQPLTSFRLADVSHVFAGIGASREETIERPGGRLPVIGVRDLKDGAVTPLSALETVAFRSPAQAQNYEVLPDDVLVTGRGTLLKFGLVGDETWRGIASGNIIVVRPDSAKGVVGAVLYAILSSEIYRPKIEVLRRGATTLLSLSPKDLAKLEISLPPFEEQRLIAELVRESQIAYRTAIEAAEIRRVLARGLIDARLFGTNQKA
jgi:Type I restriction modification DNA specificity domain